MTAPTTDARFSEKVTADGFHRMPAEYQDLLVRLLTIQADCEIGGPNVYGRQWFLDAPTADDMYRVTQILAEEIDHFRLMNRLLQEMDADQSALLRRPNAERYLAVFRETEAPTWADVAAFCC